MTTTGAENVFLGFQNGQYNVTGNYNTAIGEHALGFAQYDIQNTFIGSDGGRNFGGASGNVSLGSNANHDGSRGKNVSIGVYAGGYSGYSVTVGGSITSSDTLNIGFVSNGGTFAGYISGTTLTVTSVTSGKVYLKHLLLTGASAGTAVLAPLTGVGGAGTYVVNNAQTVGSAGSPVTFTAGAFAPQTLVVPMTGLTTLGQAATAIQTAFQANTALFANGIRGCYVVNGGTVVNFGMIGGNAALDTCTISYTQGANTETLAITNGQNGTDCNSIAIGHSAMINYTATTTFANISIGNLGMSVLTTAQNNIGIGLNNFLGLTSGTDNIGIGSLVLSGVTTGQQNIAIGSSAGASLTTQNSNILVGYRSGWKLVGASTNNIAIGTNAFNNATAGANNIVIGTGAMNGASTGTNNVVIGNGALSTQASTASNHIAVGINAMNGYVGNSNVQTDANVAIGPSTLNGAAGAGVRNLAVGANAGAAVTSGSDNTLLGNQNGKAITTGGTNTVVGARVGSVSLTTFTGNILIGVDANTDTATSNTLIIRGAGATAVPAIYASAINTVLPKVAIGAGGGAAAPVAGTDILAGMFMLWKNSTDSTAKFYYNDAGTLKSVALT